MARMSGKGLKKLKSIAGLKKINFGQSVPRHSLLLLHWFANILDINNVIRMRFNPFNGDYGSHLYHNKEGLLDPLPPGYLYFTVGNLNEYTDQQLPDYVRKPPAGYRGKNSDRIVFRVREQSTVSPTIDKVYLTQHSANHRSYDPEYTYEITTKLLRKIREFSVEEENHQSLRDLRDRFGRSIDDSQLQDICNTCGQLAGLGLLLRIVLQANNNFNYRPHPEADSVVDFEFQENTQNYRHTSHTRTDTRRRNLYLLFGSLFFVSIVIIIIIIILFLSK